MLDLELETIAFQIFNFLLLTVGLYFLLFRPGIRRVRERAARRAQAEAEIAREREQAARARAEWEERLARAEDEAAAVIARAQEAAQAEREALVAEAQGEVERILADARDDAQKLQRRAAETFRDDLVDAVLGLAGELVGQVAPSEVHDALVQELSDRIWELGRGEMERVNAFRSALGERTPTARVTSARPLTSDQQGLLARTFTALADRHINLELSVDPGLAAGLRVRLGDILVDHSIAGELDELREMVSRSLEERLSHG
jgi:F-type H+-transporting ATPase subunit b